MCLLSMCTAGRLQVSAHCVRVMLSVSDDITGSGGPLPGDDPDELSEAARVGDDQRNFFYCMSRQVAHYSGAASHMQQSAVRGWHA